MSNNAHPLEDVFNITPGSFKFDDPVTSAQQIIETAGTITDPTTGEVIQRKSTPASTDLDLEERIDDLHVDAHLEAIRGAAFDAFEKQSRLSQEVDPKFSARNAEVAAQYLNIALNAVNSRVDAKHKRQKVRIARQDVSTPNSVTNNVYVADRNVMLQEMLKKAMIDDGEKK